jgi:hypothetical protein
LTSKQWWLNDWRQADWGVYYELPYADDGLLADSRDVGGDMDTPDSGTEKSSLISHHPEAWQPRGGFVVEVWQAPIGSDPQHLGEDGATRDAGIIDEGAANGSPKRIASKIVKLTEMFGDDDDGTNLSDYHPASRGAITTGNRVSRYHADSHGVPLRGASTLLAQNTSTTLQANGEIHIRGSLMPSVGANYDDEVAYPPPKEAFRLDPSAFSYFVVIRFFIGGPRVYGSSKRLMTQDAPTAGSDVDMYVIGEGEASADLGYGGAGYSAYARARGLRVVPPPQGLPVDPTVIPTAREGESYRTLPSVTLKGIRTSILTEKP